jgi:SpoVK/Ycf46/Vps4 family AAA+-type ATPase
MSNYNNELNKLMTQNLSILSLCNFDQYNNILNDNQNLKIFNYNLTNKNNELLNKNNLLTIDNNNLIDYNQKLSEENKRLHQELYIRCILPTLKQKNTVNTVIHNSLHNKTINTVFKLNTESYNKDQIDNIIKSINNIKDIMKLTPIWKQIRHNQILYKLQYLTPVLSKLDKMIGLKDIKSEIFKKIIYYVKNKHNNEYLHTIISGPAGVGKTEIAKLYAQLFVRLGILKTDKFIEIKRNDLVGEYLGQTAPKTKELLESAMGGVLFLDEAYSLGSSDKRDSYSKEAIDMINQYLSERKGEFMFIIAGYEDDIENCLLSYNKGMKRRFHSHFKIKGYNAEEMKDIFLQKIYECKYTTNIKNNDLINFFKENLKSFKYFGGDIEKLVNEIKYTQCLRIFNNNIDSKEINMTDLSKAFENMNIKKEEDYELSLYM